jgi:hypothetical protein
VLIATPYDICLQQNKNRDRVVPEHVIKKMYLTISIPQYYEGWDNIRIIRNYNTNLYDLNATNNLFNGVDGLNFINQDNPHHTLTIGNHCRECMKNVQEYTNDSEDFLALAALFHDIGKGFTKDFHDSKGNVSEIAHYYNHQNVSAYESIFYLPKFEDNELLEIIKYIQWHMQPFNLVTDKAKNKFIRLVGKDFYEKLMILHIADVNAK